MKPLDFFKFDLCEERDYSKSQRLVKKSIIRYGFIVPVTAMNDGQMIAGRLRWLIAKELELDSIPCVIVDNLDDDEAKEFGFIDNKIGTRSQYQSGVLDAAVEKYRALKHFGFRIATNKKKDDAPVYDAFPGMVKKREYSKCVNFFYVSFLRSKKKLDLSTIKHQPDFYNYVIEKMTEYISTVFKSTENICIVYSPKRRTLEGNIAERIALTVAERTGIKAYVDAIVCHNRDRIHPEFEVVTNIEEPNIILIDDILTSGATVQKCVELLEGKNIHVIVGLCNKYS